jgi:hypothetical protein
MPRCYPNIYMCIQCLPWHCQSVLIFWHFDCSLDFFNFSLRGTKIHPKKPARLHFLDQLKASFSSNICPDCISCHLEFQKFMDPPTVACPVSTYFQKFSIYLKTFWEPWSTEHCSWAIISQKEFKSWVTHISFMGKQNYLLSNILRFALMQLILVKIKWHIKWKYWIQKFHDICLSYYFNIDI